MKILEVKTGRPYQIIIDRDIIRYCGEYISKISKAQKIMVITDSNVEAIYYSKVKKSLEEKGFQVYNFTFEAGEQSKKLRTVMAAYNELANLCFSRSDLIVALGGGVTGDMAGFIAATYQRGIEFVQIPTSLLAQVDSSVGGKTGIDIAQGKNLVGAFWQPSLVLIDIDTLDTLPKAYFDDGMAEVIKYGCIKSKDLFEKLEENNARNIIEQIIYECVNIKRQVVENDEEEKGERMLLNFGHTFGHSLEKIYNYSTLSHGQAVAIGMVIVTKASENNNITEKGTTKRLIKILKKYNLPTKDINDLKNIVENSFNDKKSSGDYINIVLVDKIGHSFIKKILKAELYNFCTVKGE